VKNFGKEQWREILFHKWVQWQLEGQLKAVQAHAKKRGMSIGLYHDLALGADPSSADLWGNQDYFFSGLRVGAPPDAFAQQGQDWGVPPPNMEAFQDTGYDLFIKEVQNNCRFGGALRIDHVMRFFRLFCIPEGYPAAKGAYLKQPFEDLLRIVCLESLRNEVLIVGEDLGTVPEYVRDRLQAMDILSYKLLYFERDDEQGFVLPQDYPELALVTITTHDLPTLAGFWIHKDINVRQETGMFETHEAAIEAAREREADKQRLLSRLDELGLLSEHSHRDARAYPEVTGDLHHAVVSFLAHTPAKIFMVTQEDLLKECDQQNLPGSTVEYPNWSLKMKYTLEDLRADPEAEAFCRMFRDVVDRSGRS
jgi:4-alpha-glucanotransferase